MGFLGMTPLKVYIRRVLASNTVHTMKIFLAKSEWFRGYDTIDQV